MVEVHGEPTRVLHERLAVERREPALREARRASMQQVHAAAGRVHLLTEPQQRLLQHTRSHDVRLEQCGRMQVRRGLALLDVEGAGHAVVGHDLAQRVAAGLLHRALAHFRFL